MLTCVNVLSELIIGLQTSAILRETKRLQETNRGGDKQRSYLSGWQRLSGHQEHWCYHPHSFKKSPFQQCQMCAPVVGEADDYPLPYQQQHSTVGLTSWWFYRSIWQMLGFTWTCSLCCNLSRALTDAALLRQAVCDGGCPLARFCCLLSKSIERQSLSSGREPEKLERAQRGSPFHTGHNNHPALENTVPGEHTALTVCRARGSYRPMCLFVSKGDKKKKKAKTEKI